MKCIKTLNLLLFTAAAASVQQKQTNKKIQQKKTPDKIYTRWFFDFLVTVGGSKQSLSVFWIVTQFGKNLFRIKDIGKGEGVKIPSHILHGHVVIFLLVLNFSINF